MVLVRFYANLREIFGKNDLVVNAPSIRDVLEYLENIGSGSYIKIMRDEKGNMRENIIILLNGKNIKFLNGLDTKISGEDIIDLFPPVAGG